MVSLGVNPPTREEHLRKERRQQKHNTQELVATIQNIYGVRKVESKH